jgi:putative flippase GtrA
MLRKNLEYFYRYLAIGVVNTLVGYSIIFGMMYTGVNPFISNASGYAVGISVSYFLNRNFNFRSKSPHKKAIPTFLGVLMTAYLLNLLTLYMCIEQGVNKYVSQMIGGGVYVITGFLGSRFLAFREG